MTKERDLVNLGKEEEELEAACAALSSMLTVGDELAGVAAAHRCAAALLLGERPRVRVLLSTMRATLTALVRSEGSALQWLLDRERRLVRAYLALESRPDLDESTRQLVRRVLLPSALERFKRIDRAWTTQPVSAGVSA